MVSTMTPVQSQLHAAKAKDGLALTPQPDPTSSTFSMVVTRRIEIRRRLLDRDTDASKRHHR